MHRARTAAVVTLLAVLTGCGDDGDAATAPGTTAPAEATSSAAPVGEGPVPGSGRAIASSNAPQWCAAITPDQLAAVSGLDVVGVASYGADLDTCSVELSGIDPSITWGSQDTDLTPDAYAASFGEPAGVYDVTESATAGGEPIVVATQDTPQVARAGVVVDGRLVEARLTYLAPDPTVTAEDMGRVVAAIVAVYAA